MPIAVLMAHTEKEYEPFDPYSRFYPAIPVPVCFSNTALYTLSKRLRGVFISLLFLLHVVDRRGDGMVDGRPFHLAENGCDGNGNICEHKQRKGKYI